MRLITQFIDINKQFHFGSAFLYESIASSASHRSQYAVMGRIAYHATFARNVLRGLRKLRKAIEDHYEGDFVDPQAHVFGEEDLEEEGMDVYGFILLLLSSDLGPVPEDFSEVYLDACRLVDSFHGRCIAEEGWVLEVSDGLQDISRRSVESYVSDFAARSLAAASVGMVCDSYAAFREQLAEVIKGRKGLEEILDRI